MLCSAPAQAESRILVMGDSMFAFHEFAGRSVGQQLESALGQEVERRAQNGARLLYSSGRLSIPSQYRGGAWDIVVMNGGGNDIWLDCGCLGCLRTIDRIISADGASGKLPEMVAQMAAQGAQVYYMGYLRSPDISTPVEQCADDMDTFEARIADFAAREPSFTFIDMADMVQPGDEAFYAPDRIHASFRGARQMAERVARIIADR